MMKFNIVLVYLDELNKMKVTKKLQPSRNDTFMSIFGAITSGDVSSGFETQNTRLAVRHSDHSSRVFSELVDSNIHAWKNFVKFI